MNHIDPSLNQYILHVNIGGEAENGVLAIPFAVELGDGDYAIGTPEKYFVVNKKALSPPAESVDRVVDSVIGGKLRFSKWTGGGGTPKSRDVSEKRLPILLLTHTPDTSSRSGIYVCHFLPHPYIPPMLDGVLDSSGFAEYVRRRMPVAPAMSGTVVYLSNFRGKVGDGKAEGAASIATLYKLARTLLTFHRHGYIHGSVSNCIVGDQLDVIPYAFCLERGDIGQLINIIQSVSGDINPSKLPINDMMHMFRIATFVDVMALAEYGGHAVSADLIYHFARKRIWPAQLLCDSIAGVMRNQVPTI